MKRKNDAKFITFEGGEGSGKSTQGLLFYEELFSRGVEAVHTREIGGTAEAEQIRNLVVNIDLTSMSELLLIMAARYEHLLKLIIPSLQAGKTVICDRYVDSSAAYQAINSGIDFEKIYHLHQETMQFDLPNSASYQGLMPDLTFFMDISPKEGISRARGRGEINKFECFELEFHNKIHQNFSLLAQKYPRIKRINCNDRQVDSIHQEVLEYYESMK